MRGYTGYMGTKILNFRNGDGHWALLPFRDIAFNPDDAKPEEAWYRSGLWTRYKYYRDDQSTVDWQRIRQELCTAVEDYLRGEEPITVTGNKTELEIMSEWTEYGVCVSKDGDRYSVHDGVHRILRIENCPFTKKDAEQIGFDLSLMYSDGPFFRLSRLTPKPDDPAPVYVL